MSNGSQSISSPPRKRSTSEFQKAIVDEEVRVWSENVNRSLPRGVVTEFRILIDDADDWRGSDG